MKHVQETLMRESAAQRGAEESVSQETRLDKILKLLNRNYKI